MSQYRYIMQRDMSTCGPLAIIHAFQWQGLNIRRGVHLPQLKEFLWWRPRHGVTTDRLHEVCTGFGFERIEFKLKNLDKILDKGGGLIVRFGLKGTDQGHAGFVDSRTPKRYYGPNIGPCQYVTRRDFTGHSKLYHSFVAWEVKPITLGNYTLYAGSGG